MENIQSLSNKVLSFCKLYHPEKYNLSVLNKNGEKWTEKIENLVWELIAECDSFSSDSAEFDRISEVRKECEKQFQDFINGLEERLNPTQTPTLDPAELTISSEVTNINYADHQMTALTGQTSHFTVTSSIYYRQSDTRSSGIVHFSLRCLNRS